ncbi:MAG: radical SAM protein [Deltaproteobacteria bacterium]|nr:radical SAM protein [Deltaproteobacteria bacterium]
MMEDRLAAVFVGAEIEDNLAIRTLAGAVRAAGMPAGFARFNSRDEIPAVVDRVVADGPALVGLSMAFQHRAPEFLALAEALRARGYGGHICAGGHVATVMAGTVLSSCAAVDTALGHEAEDGIVRLLRADGDRGAWGGIPALAWRDEAGVVRCNPPAPVPRDLDVLPLPVRDTPLHRHLGLPFAPLAGSRGCYGSCRFCAICTFHRLRPGPRLRFRTPGHVAREMAGLYHEHGARIFCFHDETMLLPRPAQSLRRLGELADHLRRLGVGRIAVIGKARPDALEPGLLGELRERLGLMRLYVGIENWSANGLLHLGRGVGPEVAVRALEACRATGVYGCYNLLLFEPEATLADVEDNLAGMERFGDVPVNFCRAEAYAGTALWTDLQRAGRLRSDGFATDYTLADPLVERLFQIVRQAFRDRNFSADGLANMAMGFGYERQLLRHFVPGPDPRLDPLLREVDALIVAIGADTRRHLGKALGWVREHPGASAAEASEVTYELASEINFGGVALQERVFELRAEMNGFARTSAAFRENAALGGPAVGSLGGAR